MAVAFSCTGISGELGGIAIDAIGDSGSIISPAGKPNDPSPGSRNLYVGRIAPCIAPAHCRIDFACTAWGAQSNGHKLMNRTGVLDVGGRASALIGDQT